MFLTMQSRFSVFPQIELAKHLLAITATCTDSRLGKVCWPDMATGYPTTNWHSSHKSTLETVAALTKLILCQGQPSTL